LGEKNFLNLWWNWIYFYFYFKKNQNKTDKEERIQSDDSFPIELGLMTSCFLMFVSFLKVGIDITVSMNFWKINSMKTMEHEG